MPPRKSNVSLNTATNDEGTPAKERDAIGIEELSLPRTMLQRLAKGVLPPNTQIQKDAVLAMQKGATLFVNHIASHADSLTQVTSRRTIAPQAVFDALKDLEFEDFVPRVEAELKKYVEMQTGKRNEYRRKVKEEKKGAPTDGIIGDAGGSNDGLGKEDEGENGERATKRVRRGSQGEGDESADVSQVRANVSPSAQLGGTRISGTGNVGETEESEMLDPPDEDGGDDDANDDQAQDDEIDEEEDEEDDEDDEDEYPDEGRRLSSLEPDPYEEQTSDNPRGPMGSGGNASDESMSGEASD